MPAGYRARAQARRRSRTGLRSATTRRSCSRGRWRCSPASANTPTRRSAGSSRRSTNWASSTTRSSSTSSATTAPSAEGGMNGLFNESTYFNGVAENVARHPEAHRRARRTEHLQSLRRRLGGRGRHALHLDQAGRIELRRHAQRPGRPLAEGDQGEERSPLAMASRDRRRADHARRGRTAGAEERRRHAADPDPGRQHGVFLRRRRRPQDRHLTQYFEIVGNRAIYHDGWLAGTIHKRLGNTRRAPADRRRLGALRHAVTTSASRMTSRRRIPTSSRRCRTSSSKEAIANHVLPIDDRIGRAASTPKIAGRPDLMAGRTSLTLYPGMSVNENSFINLKNASHTITADVDIPAGRRGGRHPRAGRQVRRLELLPEGRQADL